MIVVVASMVLPLMVHVFIRLRIIGGLGSGGSGFFGLFIVVVVVFRLRGRGGQGGALLLLEAVQRPQPLTQRTCHAFQDGRVVAVVI